MFPFLSLASPFGVERRPVSGGRVFITQTSKEGRDSPDLTLIHLVDLMVGSMEVMCVGILGAML